MNQKGSAIGSALTEGLGDANPGFTRATFDQPRNALASGQIFFGIDRSNKAMAEGFAPYITIFRQSVRPGTSLNSVAQVELVAAEAHEDVEHLIQHRRVRLNAGEAEEMVLRMQTALTERSKLVDNVEVRYFLVTNNKIYVVALGTLAKWYDSSQSMFQTIIQSFEFTEQLHDGNT